MIPKIIHYCWFGRGEMPQLAKDCIASWHKYMPDWEYKLWNEDNFDVNSVPYVKEAYEARKFAFVSDVVRLYALNTEGGVYFDTDVEVFKSFDQLLNNTAFAGYEGSKRSPVGTCVLGSEPNGQWVNGFIHLYDGSHFIWGENLDLTTNVQRVTNWMMSQGFICDGIEKDFNGVHILPEDYFSPRKTTGEYVRSENTYCEHKGLESWKSESLKSKVFGFLGTKTRIKLIKIKRLLFG